MNRPQSHRAPLTLPPRVGLEERKRRKEQAMHTIFLFLHTALAACELSDSHNVKEHQFLAFQLARQPHFKGKPFEGLAAKLKQSVVFPAALPSGNKRDNK